jgi:DNA-binding IclR family transcriptional regulator
MPPTNADGTNIQAVDRTLQILEYIRDTEEIRITELANSLGVSKSTVHNHLSTLSDHGYIIKTEGKYQLGLRFLSFAHMLQESNRLYLSAKPEIDDLVDRIDERSQVLVEENGHGIYIYQETGTRSITTESYVGTTVELHSSSIGKALLAFQPEEMVDRVIDRDGLPERTEHTVTSEDELKTELETIRETGVAFDDEEGMLGMRCIAAPVKNQAGRSVGAISVSGPCTRMDDERFREELPESVRQTAQAIELQYQFS